MGGFGAISGMINSIKENRKLAASRKTSKDNKELYIGKKHKKTKALVFKDDMTQAEHKTHRKLLKNKRRKSKMILGLIVFVMCALVSVFVFFLTGY